MAPLLGTSLTTIVAASCFASAAHGWTTPIVVPSGAAATTTTTTTAHSLGETQRRRLTLLQSRVDTASLARCESLRRRRIIGSPLRAASSSSSSHSPSVESIAASVFTKSPTEERSDGSVATTTTAPRPASAPSTENVAASLVNAIRALPRARSGTERSDLYRKIESRINALEGLYQPPQTLGFYAAILEGDWHHLFATQQGVGTIGGEKWFEEDEVEDDEEMGVAENEIGSIAGGRVFLHSTDQSLECRGRRGNLTTTVAWEWFSSPPPEQVPLSENREDHSEAPPLSTASSVGGTFQVRSDFEVTDSGRLLLFPANDRIVRPHRGSVRRLEPKDVPPLVRHLRRAMPPTLFGLAPGPHPHAADVTYLDTEVRIVRYTGGPATLEGARDVFLRSRRPNRRESTDRDNYG